MGAVLRKSAPLWSLAVVMMPQAGTEKVIALTGATGSLGRRVVERLAGQPGIRLRLVVRDAARGPRVPGAEVVAAPGGYADGAGLAAALDGAHTVYLVSAAEAEDRLRQHRTAVRAVADAGVQRIVSGRTTLPPTPRTLGAGP